MTESEIPRCSLCGCLVADFPLQIYEEYLYKRASIREGFKNCHRCRTLLSAGVDKWIILSSLSALDNLTDEQKAALDRAKSAIAEGSWVLFKGRPGRGKTILAIETLYHRCLVSSSTVPKFVPIEEFYREYRCSGFNSNKVWSNWLSGSTILIDDIGQEENRNDPAVRFFAHIVTKCDRNQIAVIGTTNLTDGEFVAYGEAVTSRWSGGAGKGHLIISLNGTDMRPFAKSNNSTQG